MRRENETCDIRRFLGVAQVLQEDLIPLITNYGHDDDELFEVTIRSVFHVRLQLDDIIVLYILYMIITCAHTATKYIVFY